MIHRIGDPEIGSPIDDPGDEALRAGDIKPLFRCQRQGEWEEHVHIGDRRMMVVLVCRKWGLSTKISWVRGLVEVESTDEPRGADC
jgi:hypothetical protein